MENKELQVVINKYSPFLLEIRKRLLFLVSIFAVFSVLGFVFYEKIIGLFLQIFSLQGINIVFTSPFQFINLAFSCGFTIGLVSIFPLIIMQVISFLKPALTKKEYRLIVSFLPLSILLFLGGFAFGALVMKWQVAFFVSRSVSLGIGNMLDISNLISVIMVTSGLMGIGFQFPVVITILMHLKIVKYHLLAKQRLWIYLIAFIFAILMPIDSIIADFFLALPLVILYELTLLLNRVILRVDTAK
jgi:sec-independent protein translocase protein TatC